MFKDMKREMLPSDRDVEVVLSDFANPGYFHLRIASHERLLNDVEQLMAQLYSGTKNIGKESHGPQTNEVVAAKFMKHWYRAKVDSINLDGTLLVKLIDYGNQAETPATRIRRLLPYMLELGAQAIPCCLNIKPVGKSWPSSLESYFEGGRYVAKVVGTKEAQTVVELRDFERDTNVGEALVKMGVATSIEEGKVNGLPADKPTVSFSRGSTGTYNQTRQVEDPKLCEEQNQTKDDQGHNQQSRLQSQPRDGKRKSNFENRGNQREDGKSGDRRSKGGDGPNRQGGNHDSRQVQHRDSGRPQQQQQRQNQSKNQSSRSLGQREDRKQVTQPQSPVSTTASDAKQSALDLLMKTVKPVDMPTQAKYLNKGKDIVLEVIDVGSPSNFWVQIENEDLKEIPNLQKKLLNHYEKKKPDSRYTPNGKSLYAARFSQDGEWYRAYVEDHDVNSATVRYLDFGNSERVSFHSLHSLESDFTSIPFQAVPCSLADIEPLSSNRWTPESIKFFAKMVCGRKLKGTVVDNNIFAAVLNILDAQSGKLLQDVLVGSGHAKKTTPVLDSKSEPVADSKKSTPVADSKKATPVADSKKATPVADSKKATPVANSKKSTPVAEKCPPTDLIMADRLQRTMLSKQATGQVTYAASPTNITIQIAESVGHIGELQTKLENAYKDYSGVYKPRSIGELVAARFHLDNMWYRAEVLLIEGDSVKVRFVDYGNEEMTPIEKIARLEPSLADIPLLGIQCCLDGVSGVAKGREWNTQYVWDQIVDIEVKGEHGDKYSVKIYNGENGQCLNRVLLDDGIVSPGKPKPSETRPTQSNASPNSSSHMARQTILSDKQVALASSLQMVNVPLMKETLVTVTDSTVPTYFTVQLMSSVMEGFILDVQRKLRVYNKDSGGYEPSAIGEIVLARFSEDKKWYRAKVLNKVDNENWSVEFIDYGNQESVPLSAVAELDPSLLTIPQLGVKCCLRGIKGLAPNQEWNRDYLQKNPVFNMTAKSLDDGVYQVDLYDIENNRSLSAELIEKGILVAESTPSQKNKTETCVEGNRKPNAKGTACSHVVKLSDLPQLHLDVGTSHNVVITDATSPSVFTVQLADSSVFEVMQEITVKLIQLHETTREHICLLVLVKLFAAGSQKTRCGIEEKSLRLIMRKRHT